MARCQTCGATIIVGGAREDGLRFCGEPCRNRYLVGIATRQLPHDFVLEQARNVHAGPCPKCEGPGPVDVHTTYWVWSAGVLTRCSQTAQVCCTKCDRLDKLKGVAFCAVLGWWGFPWGFIFTPIQLIKNFGGMFHKTDSPNPSEDLVDLTYHRLGSQWLAEAKQEELSKKKEENLPLWEKNR